MNAIGKAYTNERLLVRYACGLQWNAAITCSLPHIRNDTYIEEKSKVSVLYKQHIIAGAFRHRDLTARSNAHSYSPHPVLLPRV
jgi:hypothetical protein